MPWYQCKGIQGAKSVWIGSQLAYDTTIDNYDIEVCYIIFEQNTIKRVYAGTVIIYDNPIIWDISYDNRIFTGGYSDLIVTHQYLIYPSQYPDPWEFIFEYDDYVSGQFLFACGRYQLSLRYVDGHYNLYLPGAGATVIDGIKEVRISRDEHNVYRAFNNITEELIASGSYSSDRPGDALVLGGYDNEGTRNNAEYLMKKFRFRWIRS